MEGNIPVTWEEEPLHYLFKISKCRKILERNNEEVVAMAYQHALEWLKDIVGISMDQCYIYN